MPRHLLGGPGRVAVVHCKRHIDDEEHHLSEVLRVLQQQVGLGVRVPLDGDDGGHHCTPVQLRIWCVTIDNQG